GSPSPLGESLKGSYFNFFSNALSPEEKDQVGGKMEQSAHRRVVPQSSTMPPISQRTTIVKAGTRRR
ncbi:hypothetical protein MTR67_052262, partial [Solanum verrucosum]